MKSMFKTALVAGLALLALSAVASTAAQAATPEGPFFKISGTRLAEGHTAEVASPKTSSSGTTLEMGLMKLTCTSSSLSKGAKFAGSTGATGSTITGVVITFQGCTLVGNGTGCKVKGGEWKTNELIGELAYEKASEVKQRMGNVMTLFRRPSGEDLAEIYVEGEGCELGSGSARYLRLKGTLLSQFRLGGKAVAFGENEVEKTEASLSYVLYQKAEVYVESKGTLSTKSTNLQLEVLGADARFEGSTILELGGYKFGVFT